MTKREFDNGVSDLQRAFRSEFSDRELRVLWRQLQRVPPQRFNVAIDKLIESHKRRPFVSEVLSALPPREQTVGFGPEGKPMGREEARAFMAKLYAPFGLKPPRRKQEEKGLRLVNG